MREIRLSGIIDGLVVGAAALLLLTVLIVWLVLLANGIRLLVA